MLLGECEIVSMENRKGEESVLNSDAEKTVLPYVILVNENSASASEILAGAVKDNTDNPLVGVTTFGKGIVQTQLVLSNNSTLKYTHAKWLTPNGRCIHNTGIEPDIEIEQMLADDVTLFDLDKEYKYDEVSQYVSALQEILNLLGYKVDREDGYFSLKTKQQLQAFEKKYNLEVNGILQQEDISILLSNLIYDLTYNQEDTVYKKALEVIK
jgi:carboxyl-terminal processing protease